MAFLALKSIFKSPAEKKKANYAKSFYGAMASKDSPSGTYKSYKTPFQQTTDDIQMDLGLKTKDADYYARLAERKEKSKKMMAQMMKSSSNNSAPSSKPKGPSAAEIALAKRKAAGQEARKKFEKEKGERRIALRKRYMKLLKV